jgi:hypothetical protein
MNVLDLIRKKSLKQEHLNDAQLLMAKSYRGVPYVDAHHDEPPPEEQPRHVSHLQGESAGADAATSEKHLNVLAMVRRKILKQEHLNDAQLLMAKSYRGVPYVDAHHDDPTPEEETRKLTYRGQSYQH